MFTKKLRRLNGRLFYAKKKEVGAMAENFGLKIGLEGEKEFKSQLKKIESSFKQ